MGLIGRKIPKSSNNSRWKKNGARSCLWTWHDNTPIGQTIKFPKSKMKNYTLVSAVLFCSFIKIGRFLLWFFSLFGVLWRFFGNFIILNSTISNKKSAMNIWSCSKLKNCFRVFVLFAFVFSCYYVWVVLYLFLFFHI